MINKLAREIFSNAVAKGFHQDKKNIGEMLALIHSEVSEALEADRKGIACELSSMGLDILMSEDGSLFKTEFERDVKNTFEDELADVMIRVMDMAEYKGINLEAHIQLKMKYNTMREYKHGKKY